MEFKICFLSPEANMNATLLILLLHLLLFSPKEQPEDWTLRVHQPLLPWNIDYQSFLGSEPPKLITIWKK